jgi:hypothetical protein
MKANKAEVYRHMYKVDPSAWVTHDNKDGTFDVSPPTAILLAGNKEQVKEAIDKLKEMTIAIKGDV